MTWPLTHAEADLARAVADWMIRDVVLRLAPDGEEQFHDLAQSNFEACCAALARLDLLVADEQTTWRIREAASRPVVLPRGYMRRDLDDLLNAFASHSFYVDDLHRHDRVILPSTGSLRRVCVAFEACGYLEAEGAGWAWTERFDPWLFYNGAFGVEDIDPADPAVRDAALASMPPKVRDWLTRSFTTHFPDFLRLMFGYWTGEGWRTEIEHIHAPDDTWDISLAVALYRVLHPKTS